MIPGAARQVALSGVRAQESEKVPLQEGQAPAGERGRDCRRTSRGEGVPSEEGAGEQEGKVCTSHYSAFSLLGGLSLGGLFWFSLGATATRVVVLR